MEGNKSNQNEPKWYNITTDLQPMYTERNW